MFESPGSNFLFIQAIGFVGFTIYALSFQLLKPRHTILMQSPAGVLNAVHFLGLGSPLAAFISITASMRDLSNGLGSDRVKRLASAAFVLCLLIAAFTMAQSWYDYCAVVGSFMMTMAQYARDNFYRYRFLCLSHQILWVIVFVMIQSLPGVLFIIGALTSNMIGVARYRRVQVLL